MHEIGRKEAVKRAGHGMDRSKAIGSGRMEQDWTWRAPKERSSVYGAYGTDGGCCSSSPPFVPTKVRITGRVLQ